MLGYLEQAFVFLCFIWLIHGESCQEKLDLCDDSLSDANFRLSYTSIIMHYNNDQSRLGVISIGQPNSTLVTTAVTCENDGLTMACPPFYYIDLLSANYGRTDSDICSEEVDNYYTYHVDYDKERAKSLAVVNATCFEESVCYLKATNELFGDPCPYTYKYLTVDFRCVYFA